jgi:hypothetical protein
MAENKRPAGQHQHQQLLQEQIGHKKSGFFNPSTVQSTPRYSATVRVQVAKVVKL